MLASVRLLPFVVADGQWNMAADEATLSSAVHGTASLRFYGWQCPTLSLGYFQPAAPALAVPGLGGLPWLRRPSGGAALVHHHELTYALALPAGSLWQPRGHGLDCGMCFHEMIRATLAGLGIETFLCSREEKRAEVLCFLHHTPGDLLLGSSKIAGSAQRKRRGAVLQHGGILLARSPFTPSLPGIAELAGITVAGETLQAALLTQISVATGWRIEPDDWTAEERLAIEGNLPRYNSSEWNERR